MSQEALTAVIVWKFSIDYHLKLSPVRELGFPRFLTMLKLMFDRFILIKVSNCDLKRALDRLK